ncbi:MAG: amidohydrolase family protein, partial [Anaerotignaceae bacterium]
MDRKFIKAKNIIVGSDLVAKENAALLIENDKIIKVYDTQNEVPQGATVVDLGDLTLMPGMIDCHNHLALDTRLENHLVKMNDCEAEQTIRAVKTMKDDLLSGVTTSRCLGDRFYVDVVCKQAQKEGRLLGPKLVVSGIGMRASHGHGYVGMPHCGVEEFRKTARANI